MLRLSDACRNRYCFDDHSSLDCIVRAVHVRPSSPPLSSSKEGDATSPSSGDAYVTRQGLCLLGILPGASILLEAVASDGGVAAAAATPPQPGQRGRRRMVAVQVQLQCCLDASAEAGTDDVEDGAGEMEDGKRRESTSSLLVQIPTFLYRQLLCGGDPVTDPEKEHPEIRAKCTILRDQAVQRATSVDVRLLVKNYAAAGNSGSYHHHDRSNGGRLDKKNDGMEERLPLPPRGSLVWVGAVVPVVVGGSNGPEEATPSLLCVYVVVAVNGSTGQQQDDHVVVWCTDAMTTYRESSGEHETSFSSSSSSSTTTDHHQQQQYARFLPPITETVDWILHHRPAVPSLPNHPDLSYWTTQFRRACCHGLIDDNKNYSTYASSAASSSSSRIWQVAGDCVEVPIRAAADRSGLAIRVVRGLAHTAYQNGHAVTLGGMVDKLAGLECVKASMMTTTTTTPVVLLIHAVDAEFRTHDDRTRFWHVLTTDTMKDHPHVLVVLHTLSNDDFLPERQVFLTKQTSRPDERYAEYLWQSHEQRRRRIGRNNNNNSSSARIDSAPLHRLLRGRPEYEITCLHSRYAAAMEKKKKSRHCHDNNHDDDNDDDDDSPLLLLQHLCSAYDQEQRRHSTDVEGEIPSVHWEDVGGVQHVRSEIMDAIELPILHPDLFRSSRIQSGILLYGPPGTGKTLVAKAVATESKLPFLSVKGPELLGSYVGESEANVRAMFDKARQLAGRNHPHGCVLFFDELDSLAPRRGESASGGNVMDRVVATLFSQLDQRAAKAPVFCIGATNRPDLLDPALLRPGRFNRLVYLGVARDSHAAIIQAQIGKLKLSEPAGIVAVQLASLLPGNLTGADVSAVVSGAVQVAMERLCRRADEQLASALSENGKDDDGTTMTIDDVLATWTEDDLQPIVDFDDFIQAARLVTPSVSQAELERYEQLRNTYQTRQKVTDVNA